MIVCAALRYPDGTLVVGPRHFDATMRKQILRLPLDTVYTAWEENKVAQPEQGFIDTQGNFYTREEAWIHASAHSQIRKRVGGDEGKLFSENLY